MGYFEKQIVTDKGLELLAAAAAGDAITFTSLRTGAGVYAEDEKEKLNSASELKDEKQRFDFSKVTLKDATLKLSSVITNKGLSEGYYLNEIGVYAKDSSGSEFLVAISLSGNEPTYMPEEQEGIPIETNIANYISYSGNIDRINVMYSSDAYASKEEFLTFVNDGGWNVATLDELLLQAHKDDEGAHASMIIDGAVSTAPDTSQNLEEHMNNPLAHQNITVDGSV